MYELPRFRKRVQVRTNHLFALILLLSLSGLVVAQTRQRLIRTESDLTGTVAGLKIVQVAPDGAAARAGLKYGDVLIAYNRHPVTNEEELDEVMKAQSNQAQKSAAELSLYLDGDMTVKTVRVPAGRLGIFTREWTLAGALVEDAILNRDDSVLAQKYADEAVASTQYTDDQILRMRLMCLNNEKDADRIRQTQIDELYRKYLPEKLRLFANYDLLYNKRYRSAAAIFERYLQLKPADVSTELSLTSSYVEIEEYDAADELLAKIVARSKQDANLPSDSRLAVLSDLQTKIYMGRGQYDRAQQRFQSALDQQPKDLYYTLGFLYCAARRDVNGEKPGAFDEAHRLFQRGCPMPTG